MRFDWSSVWHNSME